MLPSVFTTFLPIFWFAPSIFLTSLRQCISVALKTLKHNTMQYRLVLHCFLQTAASSFMRNCSRLFHYCSDHQSTSLTKTSNPWSTFDRSYYRSELKMDFSQPVLDHIFDRYHNITSIDIWSSVTSLAETEAGVGGRPVRVLQSAKILHGQNRWKPKTRKVSKKHIHVTRIGGNCKKIGRKLIVFRE